MASPLTTIDSPQREIEQFTVRYGEAHLRLLYHAAFPLSLTPDLLYRLWANIQKDYSGQITPIPWIAVSDILFSNFCEEVGYELYEIKPNLRRELLHRLKSDHRFGDNRLKELAKFMLAYTAPMINGTNLTDRTFAKTQRWGAIAQLQPEMAARELAQELTNSYQNDCADLKRKAEIIQRLSAPLAKYPMLIKYAQGMSRYARGDAVGATNCFQKLLTENKELSIAGIPLQFPEELSVDNPNQDKSKPLISLRFWINFWSSIYGSFLNSLQSFLIILPTPRDTRIVTVGMGGSGKTTIINKIAKSLGHEIHHLTKNIYYIYPITLIPSIYLKRDFKHTLKSIRLSVYDYKGSNISEIIVNPPNNWIGPPKRRLVNIIFFVVDLAPPSSISRKEDGVNTDRLEWLSEDGKQKLHNHIRKNIFYLNPNTIEIVLEKLYSENLHTVYLLINKIDVFRKIVSQKDLLSLNHDGPIDIETYANKLYMPLIRTLRQSCSKYSISNFFILHTSALADEGFRELIQKIVLSSPQK